MRGLRTLGPVVLVAACGNGNHGQATSDAGSPDVAAQDAPAEVSPVEAGAMRPFRLATGGLQLLVTGPSIGLQLTPAQTAKDDDLVDVHQEYYGVPWAEFSKGEPPPQAWVDLMQVIHTFVYDAGKQTFLSISMLDGTRKTLAPQVVVQNGSLSTQPNTTSCYDFATDPTGPAMKQAYLAYVTWMMNEFNPTYVNIAVEVNLFFESCPSAAAGVIDVANAAYATAKALLPSVPVFPSFQIEHLYGYSSPCPTGMSTSQCFDSNYAQIAPLKRDRFAMSSYPTLPGVIDHPSQVPADWFSRGAARGNERALVAETGWNSSTIVAQTSGGTCVQVEPATEADTAAYLGVVLAAARTVPLDLVDWWSDQDLVVSQLMTDCPCTFDATWCSVLSAFSGAPVDAGTDTYFLGQLELKAFGAMGLRDYAGNPKPTTFPVWQAALQTP